VITDILVGVGMLASQILDGFTTWYILKHGGTEANPILVTFGLSKHPTILLILKIALGAFCLRIATWQANSGYVPGEVSMGTVAAASLYLGVHNLFEIISAKL
jgi:hypothetical protein